MTTNIKVKISKTIATYELYIMAYTNQQIAETMPMILITFSLSLTKDKITASRLFYIKLCLTKYTYYRILYLFFL